MSPIGHRIARSLPGASFELEALVRLVGIEATASVETAAVTCRHRARLLVNPTFVEEHCQRDEHLFLLVMHEMWHVLLGHTTLYQRSTYLHNVAFDALINAGLARQHPQPAYRGFFEKLNRPDVFPELLLRPPVGWPNNSRYKVPGPRGTSELLRRLYPPPGHCLLEPLYDELLELLETGRNLIDPDDDGPLLIGNHDDTADPMDDPLFGDVVKRIVGKWPPPPFRIEGRDAGGVVDDWFVEHDKVGPDLRRQFARILGFVLVADNAGGRTIGRDLVRELVGLGPLPNAADRLLPARRALMGDVALSNQLVSVHRRRREPPARALVYLDVSGSMASIIPYFLALLVPAARAGRVVVRQFSTEVLPLSLADLGHGALSTTNGTDIACVLADIASRTEQRVLIVTDGEVGAPSVEQMAPLLERAVQIHTVLPKFGQCDDLAPHSTIHYLTTMGPH
jgi:hypothetical protein